MSGWCGVSVVALVAAVVAAVVATTNAQLVSVQEVEGVRLVGGTNESEGNVQVFANGRWGFICDDRFDFFEADVVCRELGYPGALTYTLLNHYNSTVTKGDSHFLLSGLFCLGTEESLENCDYSSSPTTCNHVEIAGVACRTSNETKCEEDQFECASSSCIRRSWVCDGDNDCDNDEDPRYCGDGMQLRLGNGSVVVDVTGAAGGHVEFKYYGRWNFIDDSSFYAKDTKVLCRQLGYGEEGGWAQTLYTNFFGGFRFRDYVRWEPRCRGDEENLQACRSSRLITRIRGSRLGVFCSEPGVSVRLVGESVSAGEAEIRIGTAEWSPVCGTGFDDLDAKVICRALGYEGDARAEVKLGSTRSPMKLLLDCLGHEGKLDECGVRPLDQCLSVAKVTCQRGGGVDGQLEALLPRDCGQAVDASDRYLGRLAKIRGGSVIDRYEAPWLATLRYRQGLADEGFLSCGAVIVSADYLLSAAHCFNSVGPRSIGIRVGDHASAYVQDSYEKEFEIEKLWIHERYEEYNFLDNDIALIRIKRKGGFGIQFNERVRPICMPRTNDNYDELGRCTLTGYGEQREGQGETPVPRDILVDVKTNAWCERLSNSANTTSSKVCTSDFFVRNPCKGDSGGPLDCLTNGRHTVYGVMSSATLCDSNDALAKVTRITKYLRWILEKMTSV